MLDQQSIGHAMGWVGLGWGDREGKGEREGHRPRLQGTAIRVALSWHSALSPYREIHAAAARGYRLSPSGTGYVGPIGV